MPILVHRSARWRLATLAAAVLLAHAWLLASPLLPAAEVAPLLGAPRALQTRTVAPAHSPAPAPSGALLHAAVAAPATAASPAPNSAAAVPTRAARAAAPRAHPSTAPPSLVPVLPDAVPQEVAAAVLDAPSQAQREAQPEARPESPLEAPPVLPASPAEIRARSEATAAAATEVSVLATASSSTASAASAEPAAVPFAPPPSANLGYEVQVDYRGVRQTFNGTLDWQHDGDRYRLHMSVALPFVGSRVQHSEGRLGRHGLHPKRFSEKTRSERAAHFDESGSRIRYSANTPDAPLLPGHQDRLSIFMQLAGLVQARPDRFPAGQMVHVPTSGARESETWAFEVKGTETIALPKGDVIALHLRRLPRKEFDTTVDVWLAPSLGHLPVRMRLLEANGNVADQRLITP